MSLKVLDSLAPMTPAPASDTIATRLAALRTAFAAGLTRDLAWRASQLQALARMMTENEAAIAEALKADLGKPFTEAATAEIDFVRKDAIHALRHLARWAKPVRVPTPLAMQPGKSFIEPSPYGVTLIIGAWNYPFQLTLAPLVGAIAAGNCAILKPSELAPHSSTLMARLVAHYLDQRAFAVFEGAADVAQSLLAEHFDLYFYTGGARVGRIVMEAGAKHLAPVILELGGKNACIVDETADLKVAARRIVWGKFLNAGQICVAPDHVYVARAVEGRLHQALIEAIRDLFGDDPKWSSDYGRIVNQAHLARLQAMMSSGRVIHGGQIDAAERYIAPTLLADASADSAVMTEEIFGPILPIASYSDLSEALAAINARTPALALYAFTRDETAAQRIAAQTRSGSLTINDVVVFMANPDLPFGGVGASGHGAYHGRFSFEAFSHKRAVLKRGFAMDSSLRYPPFNKAKTGWLRRLA